MDKWANAMNDGIKLMVDNNIWNIVKQSEDVKSIGCKWKSIIKRDSKGNIEIYKVRFVAKCFTQKEDINYKETFS